MLAIECSGLSCNMPALILGGIGFTLCMGGMAQTPHPPTISDTDIARIVKKLPKLTDADVASSARSFHTPSDEELARVPIPGKLDVDALPVPASRPGKAGNQINFGDVARAYDAARTGLLPPGMKVAMPSLFVFISFAMPRPTLERLVAQSQAVGATLLLRGLVNGSFRETVQRCQALIGQQQAVIQIDPQSFDRFAVAQTPTFVLLKPGQGSVRSHGPSSDNQAGASCAAASCTDPSSFALVRGDVSIGYALRSIAERDSRFESDAKMLLRLLPQGRP